MRRSYLISDLLCRLSHAVRRNRGAIIIYTLISLLFLIVGVACGVGMNDKTAYLLKNGAPIFCFLRGERGLVAFLFIDLVLTLVYCIFSLSAFFNRAVAVLSLAPVMYSAYSLGIRTCVIVTVYAASALPMLFVFFVPATAAETGIICVLSYKCFAFAAQSMRGFPCAREIREYYMSALPFVTAIAFLELVKTVSLALFGSSLIGVI